MRDIINATIGTDHFLKCNTYALARNGEGLTPCLSISIPEGLLEYWAYIDFKKANGETFKTPRLEYSEGKIVYDIDGSVLDVEGKLEVQVVFQNANNETWKTYVKEFAVRYSINATDDIPNKQDFITEAQKLLDELGTETEGIKVELGNKQDMLIAGDNITIKDSVISAKGGGGNITVDQTFDPKSKNAQSGYAIDQYYSLNFSLFREDIRNELPIKCHFQDGLSAYQKSEKDDTKVNLAFTEVQDETAKSTYGKIYDRRTETGLNALSLGSSVATGKRSFAAGSSNIAANEKAFATGCDNIVAGKQSFGTGYANYVESDSSFISGAQSVVKGVCSFVHGLFCKALGTFSAVFGNSNVANYPNQFVIGKFNKNKTDTVFEVGYGADENNRANLFEVGKNWDTGDDFVRIGDTTLTEAQLKKLLELIG